MGCGCGGSKRTNKPSGKMLGVKPPPPVINTPNTLANINLPAPPVGIDAAAKRRLKQLNQESIAKNLGLG